MGLNRIVLLGTVAQDPEIRYNTSGQPTTSFTLGVQRQVVVEGKPETDYIRVITRRGLAERCGEQLRQGDLVTVEGRLYTHSYETREGRHRKTVEVEAVQVEVVQAPRPAAGGTSQPTFPPPGRVPPSPRPLVLPGAGDAPF
jgi:single-strand DNA-binding protein